MTAEDNLAVCCNGDHDAYVVKQSISGIAAVAQDECASDSPAINS